MGGRELVILLLGLAIIAVVLRGLYVAISARRGQIKLAIDKNIPQDVDLEAMELAELPGGGARVVERSLEQVSLQNNALEEANQRAEAFELGDVAEESDSIPVLMDAVELAGPNANIDSADEDSAYEDSDDDDYLDEDPDSVLFDYGEEEPEDEETPENAVRPVAVDSMQQVAPDYPEDFDDDYEDEEPANDLQVDESAGLEQDSFSDEQEQSEYTGDNAAADNYSDFEDELDSPNPDEQAVDEDEATADTDEVRRQPELGSLSDLQDEFGDFSMTAGERIGFDQVPASAQGSTSSSAAKEPGQRETQSGLFDQVDDDADAQPAPKRKSLFAAFARKPRAEREQRRAPEVIAEPELIQAPTAEIDPVADAATEPQLPTEPSEVIVLNVMAREGYAFAGEALLHALITAGLKFGEMNIFHQRFGNESKGPVIFSVANVLNPGTFDLNNMEEFSTLGVSLFLALPAPINNLEAFEQMLQVAQQIRGALDGELKDDNRNMMTAQTIEHYRQRVRDFELRMLKAAGGRS